MPAKISSGVESAPELGFRVWRAEGGGGMSRAHMHPDVEVNLVERGEIRYFFGGRFHAAREGAMAVFWGGVPHQAVRKSPGLSGLWMTLPLRWLLGWRHAGTLKERLMAGEFLSRRTGEADRAALLRWIDDCGSGRIDRREIAAGEVEAWLSRLSLDLPARPRHAAREAAAAGPLARMAQVTRYVGEHYAEEISIGEIARATGFHPKYLPAFFRRHASLTLWEYVTRLRLAHAQRLLLSGERTVVDAALEAGFGSASAFYQAFRKRFPGLTPARSTKWRGTG